MNSGEWLCLWYLRLNGYFTLPNFYAHGCTGPLTEIDVLAVRFPHSQEQEFEDDSALAKPTDRVDVVFAEAKIRQVDSLNGPWCSPEKRALDYVLKRVGIVPTGRVAELAEGLYSNRKAEVDGFTVRIVCFGTDISPKLRREGVHFVSWAQVLSFINKRFKNNDKLKADHEAWDDFGKYLWEMLCNNQNPCPDTFFSEWDRRSQAGGSSLDP